jgi:hypothetical protein
MTVKKHLQVNPRFTGFDVTRIDKEAKTLHSHSETLFINSPEYKATLQRLNKVDKSGKLATQFKYLMKVLQAEGKCDGDVPKKLVDNLVKGKVKTPTIKDVHKLWKYNGGH